MRHLMHWTAAELGAAEASQMFAAVAGFGGEAGQVPFIAEAGSHALPQKAEAIVLLQGLGEAEDVVVNQIDPTLDEARLHSEFRFVEEPGEGGVQRDGVVSGEDWRTDASDWPVFGGLMIASPAEFPGGALIGGEGVQCVCGKEAGATLGTFAPFAIDENSSAAGNGREKVGGGLLGPDDACGCDCFHDADMGEVILIERRADREGIDPGARFDVEGFDAAHARAR